MKCLVIQSDLKVSVRETAAAIVQFFTIYSIQVTEEVQWPSTGEYIKEICLLYTMEYHLA